jgi:methylated-DNA-[protein]-cysteine S-methyltransferase
MNRKTIPSPIGDLRLASEHGKLVSIAFHADGSSKDSEERDPVLEATASQLAEYFAGDRRDFDLPLAPAGTPFQKSVWRALQAIPFGELCSYRDIAEHIGKPSAVRAVGAANGRNPLPIVVPCHRVIGSDGSLTGFAGGLDTKRALLALEGSLPPETGGLFG